jgi:hypothetical protein
LVDPTSLEEGDHFTELLGYDADKLDNGPLFSFPITVLKSASIGYKKTLENLNFGPSSIYRKFLQIPPNSTFLSKIPMMY